MFLNYEDLQVIVNGPQGQAEALLKSLDQELVSLKRQVSLIPRISQQILYGTGNLNIWVLSKFSDIKGLDMD